MKPPANLKALSDYPEKPQTPNHHCVQGVIRPPALKWLQKI
jgi:hypothetical protein